jgi:hypothetical protein
MGPCCWHSRVVAVAWLAASRERKGNFIIDGKDLYKQLFIASVACKCCLRVCCIQDKDTLGSRPLVVYWVSPPTS